MNDSVSLDHPFPARRRWMAVLARAKAGRLAALLDDCGTLPTHTILRGPEGGLVMVRGRAGGGGSAFNLGEMTVTRCTVRTETGFVGHSYVAGREERCAELAALVDALMQDRDRAADIEARVIAPLERQQTKLKASRVEGGRDTGAILRHANNAHMSNELSPGFADSVSDAQSCFRAVLDAMARPGQVHAVGGVSTPAPLYDAAAAVLLTLADHETPLWLDPEAAPARTWIAFHTGAPIVPPAQAMFAMALSLPDLVDLPDGTDEMPETSATVILQVASLTTGQRFVLEGPGLREPRILAVDGLPADFAAIWQRNHGLYPRGIDLILCAGNQLTALPRSVSIREA